MGVEPVGWRGQLLASLVVQAVTRDRAVSRPTRICGTPMSVCTPMAARSYLGHTVVDASNRGLTRDMQMHSWGEPSGAGCGSHGCGCALLRLQGLTWAHGRWQGTSQHKGP